MSNHITERIKECVPLPQAIEAYTGERFFKNKMRCPLHYEKTASFTVYPENNTFYCFGCGAAGGIIHFVQLYFDKSFKEAITQLDYDYGLGLTHRLTFSEYDRIQGEAAKRRSEQEQKRRIAYDLKVRYWEAFDRVLSYERDIQQFKPLSPTDEPHPCFIKALQNIDYARYLLECAENERRLFKA